MAYDIGPLEERPLGARRLLALAAYLETVDGRFYDQRTFRRIQEDGSQAMCALGHGLTALPDLIGLRWRKDGCQDVVREDGSGVTQDPLVLAAEAFELTYDDAAMIFGLGTRGLAFYGCRNATEITPGVAAAAIAGFALRRIVVRAAA